MKKFLTTLSIAAMLAIGIGGLAACSDSNGSVNGNGAASGGDAAYSANVSEGFSGFDTDSEVYGFSAASAAMIISSMNGARAEASAGFAAKAAAGATATAAGTAVTDEQTIDTLNNYMTLVENLLGSGGYTFSESVSDDENYSVKLLISCGDMYGGSVEYAMYYNETLVSETTEKDGSETETKQVYSLDGAIYIEGVSYPLSGRKEVSTESDLFSTETETERRLTVTLSETSYMKVEQEVSEEDGENEQEYTYSIYENGVMTESCTFEYEQDNGETEIEMRQSTRGSDGTLETQTFCFEKETRLGQEVIKIKVGGNGGTETYTVTVETAEDGGSYYVYTLANGQTYSKNRG